MAGAIQVPHTGQPVLFLADHPLTGGYPVIGNVAEYHPGALIFLDNFRFILEFAFVLSYYCAI